ncbi:MAG: N-acetyl-gamma-glutamyl-phosphate reductase [Verrucomicrobiota bacterium]|nr:N-acetyl-gamma-glutamyl-phosphate reductase [Verrucomicrobiota bacterium]
MNLEKIAVVGASGYSGEELVRLLSRHPGVELVALTSRQAKGQTLEAVAPRFAGTKYASLAFIESKVEAIAAAGARYVFLALPHGVAATFAGPLLGAGLRVLDLSADFRVKDPAVYEEFYRERNAAPELVALSVYGMPEIYRARLRDAQLVACPGCYPTSIILPLAPLLRRGLLQTQSIVVSSMSGVSGAGRSAKVDHLFVECNESARAYGLPKHRHLSEIEQELSLAAGERVIIDFAPHLIPVTRGIHTTIWCAPANGVEPEEVTRAFRESYDSEPFIRLLGEEALPDIKNVTHTNFLDVAWRHDPRTGRLVVLSAEDNLVKGAAGQAVQCLNVMCGWPESTALLP